MRRFGILHHWRNSISIPIGRHLPTLSQERIEADRREILHETKRKRRGEKILRSHPNILLKAIDFWKLRCDESMRNGDWTSSPWTAIIRQLLMLISTPFPTFVAASCFTNSSKIPVEWLNASRCSRSELRDRLGIVQLYLSTDQWRFCRSWEMTVGNELIYMTNGKLEISPRPRYFIPVQ